MTSRDDDPIGELMARTSLQQAPLATMLAARARSEVRLFPDQAAANLAAWQQLAIETVGESPASRAASDEDNRHAVAGQLSLIPGLRAESRMAKARVLELERRLRSLAAMINAEPGAAAMKARVECVLIDAGLLDDPEVVCG